MTRIEELEQIVVLIRKHNLPLSPILEFAINERREQYAKDEASEMVPHVVSEPKSEYGNDKKIDDYLEEFAHLSVGSLKGRKQPNKAILLLCIMRLIGTGVLEANQIPLEKMVADEFEQCWQHYFPDTKAPTAWTPFYHMKSQSFWHFKATDTEERMKMLMSFGGTPSIGKMRPVIKYAYLDDALFELIQDGDSRQALEKVLIETYLQ